jgi:hypothetical protein
VVDFYLLQFWPAPIAADRILRQTSQAAAYWHRARTNRSPTAEEAAELERQEAERRAEQTGAGGAIACPMTDSAR